MMFVYINIYLYVYLARVLSKFVLSFLLLSFSSSFFLKHTQLCIRMVESSAVYSSNKNLINFETLSSNLEKSVLIFYDVDFYGLGRRRDSK